MAPTLEPGDRILTLPRVPAVGDVVVANDPDGLRVVKRVVAAGPATVTIAAGELAVDGEVLAEPWCVDETPGSGTWQLAAGEVFLLSDARHRTLADSRTWGPRHRSALVGVVVGRYRPLARMGRVG